MTESALEFSHVSFAYAVPEGGQQGTDVLADITFSVPEGSFTILSGQNGSGKTTLLRLAKPELAPHGRFSGTISFFGRPIDALSPAESASGIGYVFQDPESQIVCDTVWHELAFGLENLGSTQEEMCQRIAETCYFFGIDSWFRKRTSELSGGQKQILALASLMVMRPRLLLLDEPTSMLDPLAAKTFLGLLWRMNQELGITVIVATHDPAMLAPYADRAFTLSAGGTLAETEAGAFAEAPSALSGMAAVHPAAAGVAAELERVYQRYAARAPWVLRDLSFAVPEGSFSVLLGGNGSGKSTALSVLAGIALVQHGKARNAHAKMQAFLPQNPRALFEKPSISEELLEWGPSVGYGRKEALEVLETLGLPRDEAFLARHPYDVSGGQEELLAIAKLLLTKPEILLLDEPTTGLDRSSKRRLAAALQKVQEAGTTIVCATHDTELVRALANTVTLIFDGGAAVSTDAESFLSRSWLWGHR